MKVFILGDDLSGNGPVWLNIIWPLYNVFAEYIETVYLPIPPLPPKKTIEMLRRAEEWRSFQSHRKELVRTVESALDPDEPNVLLVLASGGRNLEWSQALEPVWHRFAKRAVHINDALQVGAVSESMLDRFDVITSFCKDLADQYAAKSKTPALFWPAHVDTLAFRCTSAFRPIDLIVVGRRFEKLHRPLHLHFNKPGVDRIYLDFVSRTQVPRPCEEEFRLLMATYSRAAAAFCYEPSYLGRFHGNSPLLARWPHAWAAGCTVFGRRPTGAGTTELMDWHESTIELPDDPATAIQKVENVLADSAGMEARRIRNVQEAIRRHDTRYRIELLLRTLGLKVPEPLSEAIDELGELAKTIGNEPPPHVASIRDTG